MQQGANTVADLLYLTFQAFLPSEPSAWVEGLATIEAPVKPVRTFGEALSFLRSWRQEVLTVVHDLGGNPEPLKLLSLHFTHSYLFTSRFRHSFRYGGEPNLQTDKRQDNVQ